MCYLFRTYLQGEFNSLGKALYLVFRVLPYGYSYLYSWLLIIICLHSILIHLWVRIFYWVKVYSQYIDQNMMMSPKISLLEWFNDLAIQLLIVFKVFLLECNHVSSLSNLKIVHLIWVNFLVEFRKLYHAWWLKIDHCSCYVLKIYLQEKDNF